MLNRSGNTTDNLELHVSATFQKYETCDFVLCLLSVTRITANHVRQYATNQNNQYTTVQTIEFILKQSFNLCFDENVYCDDKKTVNIVFPLFAVLCFSTPKSFKIPLQGLSELGIRSFRSTVVLQSSQFVPQKSRSRYCVLIATLSQITFSDIKKTYLYT